MPSIRSATFVLLMSLLAGGPALAAPPCQNTGNFDAWLQDFKSEAAEEGISPKTLAAALAGVSYDPSIVAKDRSQRVFRQSFEQFSGRMISPYRLKKGHALMRQHAATLEKIERQFGVPGAVVVAIWGLETDFGANRGDLPTIRALATLAYDCRRSDMFRANLVDALKIIERGDLTPAEMRGAWAGELGQAQFMASSYLKYAVDFDGDGKRDLLHSSADVLASTANYLKGYGWKRGAGWSLGEANFAVLKQWNKSEVYARTVGLFASKLANAQD
jgi:lytic murein transglycosylase